MQTTIKCTISVLKDRMTQETFIKEVALVTVAQKGGIRYLLVFGPGLNTGTQGQRQGRTPNVHAARVEAGKDSQYPCSKGRGRDGLPMSMQQGQRKGWTPYVHAARAEAGKDSLCPCSKVSNYPFDDHNAPPFELIRPFCQDMDLWLNADERNVAVVHCTSGKGQTGVMICAYLLHDQMIETTKEALRFYGEARTQNAKGVTIPSQRRYVQYYGHLLRNRLEYSPKTMTLIGFKLEGIPNFFQGTCCPFFTICLYKTRIFTSQIFEIRRGESSADLMLPQPLPLCGDIKVEFFHQKFGKEKMFHFWFNTFFVDMHVYQHEANDLALAHEKSKKGDKDGHREKDALKQKGAAGYSKTDYSPVLRAEKPEFPLDCKVIVLPKDELDKANKDKRHIQPTFQTYAVLRSLVAPDQPKDKSFAELKTLLKAHYDPKPLVIAERFRFYRRDQTAEESISEFLVELRRLAAHCEFGQFLDEALRDRLVCGLRNDAIQKRLLSEADVTLAKAVQIASSMESAEKQSLQLNVTKPGAICQVRVSCNRCNSTDHSVRECRIKDSVVCFRCKKKGHIVRACREKGPSAMAVGRDERKAKTGSLSTKWVDTEEAEEVGVQTVYVVNGDGPFGEPISVSLQVNGVILPMEIDTGAAVSIIPERVRQELFPYLKPQNTRVRLRTYTAEQITVLGTISVQVKFKNQTRTLSLFVVNTDGPTLLGRDWMRQLKLDWSMVNHVLMEKNGRLEALMRKYEELFKPAMGAIQGVKAKLTVKADAHPKFCKARSVPFSIKQRVGEELDRLEKEGIVERVMHSDWATPIVPVPKKDGTFRICGDYKVTVNPALEVDQYPLPKPEDIFASLAGGTAFSKIDLSQAYQQLLLDKESQQYLTVNTHQGLYRYKRLTFGVASAPAIFQRVMDTMLQGIPNVVCYLDDILVTGATIEAHLDNLEAVLHRLQQHGVRMNKEKSVFLAKKVTYLGHVIDAEGLHKSPTLTEAIVQAPPPQNTQELRSFLGMLNYYGKFIPNLATLLHPLNGLLRSGVKWQWSAQCRQAFEKAKEALQASSVLVHYDTDLPLVLAADASSYGVGAVISHRLPSGEEKPIAFASRTLTRSEENYAQLEKEALALVFGVKKFHQFLYGHQFTLLTDHKPLTTILGSHIGIPPLAAARMQRWALLLSAYQYDIRYRQSECHGNADALSRLPIVGAPMEEEGTRDVEVYNVTQLETLPVTYQQLKTATNHDPVLGQVVQCIRNGWPPVAVSDELKPYVARKLELTLQDDCVLWGTRVVIPKRLQAPILEELHKDHAGICRIKALARSYVWWPGLDREVEQLVASCLPCQSVKNAPSVAPLHPWLWPAKPWQRIHVDFAGPVEKRMLMVVVDAHSKWPEVIEMTSTTSELTIQALRGLFAVHGLPDQLVSDNGPQFVSKEFQRFMKENGVQHTRCAPYHPSSNGLAERFVQTLKNALRRTKDIGRTFQHRLAGFLLAYRTTPHATTNVAPCELLMNRKIRTRLDLLHPDIESRVAKNVSRQKAMHDLHAKAREFLVGQRVMLRNLRDGPKWVPGVVIGRQGPLSYVVQNTGGEVWKRHVDQIGEVGEFWKCAEWRGVNAHCGTTYRRIIA
eukprot:Em0017g619a